MLSQGQAVGLVGNSGNAKNTPSHLHYEVRPTVGAYNTSHDPLRYLPAFSGPGGTAVAQPGSTASGPTATAAPSGAQEQALTRAAQQGETPGKFATVRSNNPGGMYPGSAANMFATTGTSTIGGGHKIANFSTPFHGAAANFQNLTSPKHYVGKTIAQAMRTWSGGSRAVPGPGGKNYDPNTIITKEMVRDPNFAIPFMKAVASGEAPGKYPMDDAQWAQAHRWFLAGGVPTGDKALTRVAGPGVPGAPAAPAATDGGRNPYAAAIQGLPGSPSGPALSREQRIAAGGSGGSPPAAATRGWSPDMPYEYNDTSHKSWYGNFDFEKGLTPYTREAMAGSFDKDQSAVNRQYGENAIKPG